MVATRVGTLRSPVTHTSECGWAFRRGAAERLDVRLSKVVGRNSGFIQCGVQI